MKGLVPANVKTLVPVNLTDRCVDFILVSMVLFSITGLVYVLLHQ